ncbi:energy transducer TonB [Cognatilysobacter segetis]|uniref:energy transducer TonB n=1 Tax=Cognatilysobacter segetis TaxID=2492394 RepID=UPI00105B99EE|nr:hypothetical protein [Lysobacter segetis]
MNRAAVLAALLPACALAQDVAPDTDAAMADVSSHRDYTDPAQRERPIACAPGDLERRPGQSLGQVFGDAWPAPPADAAKRERATVEHWGKLVMPAGLAPKDVTVVVAALVGADGEPLRAEPLCATETGFDTSAARTVMRSRFAPTRYDGVPAVGATVVVVQYARNAGGMRTGRRP